MRSRILFVCSLLALTTAAWPNDWPSWRGPSRNGVSAEKDLPERWGPAENIGWKVEMPAWSGSTPIIWGDYIFINTAEGGERREGRGPGRRRWGGGPGQPPQARGSRTPQPPPAEQAEPEPEDPKSEELALMCLDRNTGRALWQRPLGGGNHQERKQNMSSPSPVTDGQHVWVMTGTGVLKCFDFQGTEIWSRNIQQDYGKFGLNWGYASSPLLDDDTLYIEVLHGMKTDDPSYVMAVDKATGKNRWKVERPTEAIRESPDAYTTPALLQYDGKTQIVVSGGDVVTGHDPQTGRELWRVGGMNPRNRPNYRVVASPVVHKNILIVPTRQSPLQVFRAGSEPQPQLLWQSQDGPDVPSPVTDGEFLYVLDDRGLLSCLRLETGEVVYGPERLKTGTYSASPVLADGKIYAISEEGRTTVVAAGPEFKVLAENELEGYTLSSPAISKGQIFIRTEQYLYAIGTR